VSDFKIEKQSFVETYTIRRASVFTTRTTHGETDERRSGRPSTAVFTTARCRPIARIAVLEWGRGDSSNARRVVT